MSRGRRVGKDNKAGGGGLPSEKYFQIVRAAKDINLKIMLTRVAPCVKLIFVMMKAKT